MTDSDSNEQSQNHRHLVGSKTLLGVRKRCVHVLSNKDLEPNPEGLLAGLSILSFDTVAYRDLRPNPEGLLPGLEWQAPKGYLLKNNQFSKCQTQAP